MPLGARTADMGSSTSPRADTVSPTKSFDYSALIPRDVDQKTREIMEVFLL